MDKNYYVYKHISPNGKIYIGITSQKPQNRWGYNGIGYKTQMFYRAIQKYGWENFKHEILYEKLTKEEAEKIERDLIQKYKSNNILFGYNISNGGNARGKVSEVTREKLRISNLGKERKDYQIPIIQYSLDGAIIKEWKCAYDVQRILNYDAHTIRECCRNRKKTAYGYIWKNKNELLTIEEIKRCNENQEPEIRSNSKMINQYNLDGVLINSFKRLKDASLQTGIDKASILKCCDKTQRLSGGYIWRYATEKLTNKDIQWCNNTGKESMKKRVYQYDLDDNFLAEYESIGQIKREYGYDTAAISRCCLGKQKTSYGYIWKYELTGGDINEECRQEV